MPRDHKGCSALDSPAFQGPLSRAAGVCCSRSALEQAPAACHLCLRPTPTVTGTARFLSVSWPGLRAELGGAGPLSLRLSLLVTEKRPRATSSAHGAPVCGAHRWQVSPLSPHWLPAAPAGGVHAPLPGLFGVGSLQCSFWTMTRFSVTCVHAGLVPGGRLGWLPCLPFWGHSLPLPRNMTLQMTLDF